MLTHFPLIKLLHVSMRKHHHHHHQGFSLYTNLLIPTFFACKIRLSNYVYKETPWWWRRLRIEACRSV